MMQRAHDADGTDLRNIIDAAKVLGAEPPPGLSHSQNSILVW